MYEYRAVVTNVVDGDTIDCSIDLGLRIATTQRLRLLGLDAPEKFGPTRLKGLESGAFLRALLVGREVVVRTHKGDSFGRWLADVWLDGQSVNLLLVAGGYAEPRA